LEEKKNRIQKSEVNINKVFLFHPENKIFSYHCLIIVIPLFVCTACYWNAGSVHISLVGNSLNSYIFTMFWTL